MGAVPRQGQRAPSTSCEAEMSAVHADDLAACQLLDVLRHNLRVSEAGPAVGSRLDHELLPSAPLRRSEELAARDAVVERHERARDAAAVLVALERRTWKAFRTSLRVVGCKRAERVRETRRRA